jgi:hypothetical protein
MNQRVLFAGMLCPQNEGNPLVFRWIAATLWPGRGDKIQENRGDFGSRPYICISRFSVYHPIFPYYIHIIPMLYPCYTHIIWPFHHRQAFSPSWRWRWRLALRKSLVSKQRRRSFKPRWDRSQWWRVALLVFA